VVVGYAAGQPTIKNADTAIPDVIEEEPEPAHG
jgi:hypothetical protein